MTHLNAGKRMCTNNQVTNIKNDCNDCNFSSDSLADSIECFEEQTDRTGQGSSRILSNRSSLKFFPGCDICPLQHNLSNAENNLDEMMERLEVMMVEETKRLQREEARMNNIPLLDLVDSDEENEGKRERPVDSLESICHSNNPCNENYSKIHSHSNISANNYIENGAYNGYKFSATKDNANNCHFAKNQYFLHGPDSVIQHHNQPQVASNQYHLPSNPVYNNPVNHPLQYINSHNDLNANLHNYKSFNNNLPKLNKSNSHDVSPIIISGGSRNVWDKRKNLSTTELNHLPRIIKTKEITEKPVFDKRFIYKASEPKSYSKMLSKKVKYNHHEQEKKNKSNQIKLDNLNDAYHSNNYSFSNEKKFIESNPVYSNESYLNNNNNFMQSESMENNSRCQDFEMNFNENSSFFPNSGINNQLYNPIINDQMYNPNINNPFHNSHSNNPGHNSKTDIHVRINPVPKTISAPLLTKRRPPHRVKPIDSEESLKVASVSAPIDRRMKALPDLWQALNHDDQNNSTDANLTTKTLQSERVDFVTPDFLNEFTHSANKKKTDVNKYINRRSSVTLLEPIDTRNKDMMSIFSPRLDTDKPPSLSGTSVDGRSKLSGRDYRRYTLEEYKRLKQEMQLGINKGSLGPDMQTIEYREKKEKLEKQKQYSHQILERNRKQIESSKYRSLQNLSHGDQTKREALPDKRKLAIEYAKTIPKPKVVTPKVYSWPKDSNINNNNSQRDESNYNIHDGEITREEFLLGDMDSIRWMKERHDQERQQIAKLLPKM